MSNENVALIRRAYDAYARGDLAAMLEVVDPDLEWTYLDPSLADPQPQVCHGRHELESALARQAGRGLQAQLEEAVGHGDRVMVVVRTPGRPQLRRVHGAGRADRGPARLPRSAGGPPPYRHPVVASPFSTPPPAAPASSAVDDIAEANLD
jgi:SnoaL-like domain